jgi:endonuclease YncB( thermonuclease family)
LPYVRIDYSTVATGIQQAVRQESCQRALPNVGTPNNHYLSVTDVNRRIQSCVPRARDRTTFDFENASQSAAHDEVEIRLGWRF